MRTWLLVAALMSAAPAFTASPAGQVHVQPTPYPEVTAAGREWYVSRQPLSFADHLYYPAGPERHFDGDVMVETGTFEGVPLFADTTVEPYSLVLVPIGRGLVQPYERRRDGDLAGTTGSRAPSFPVESAGRAALEQDRPWPGPTQEDVPPAAATQHPSARQTVRRQPAPPPEREETGPLALTARAPEDNRGIWIRYEGVRWQSAGEAVERDASFTRVGEYRGFPVYRRSGGTEPAQMIFIPTRDDVLAPYRRETGGGE